MSAKLLVLYPTPTDPKEFDQRYEREPWWARAAGCRSRRKGRKVMNKTPTLRAGTLLVLGALVTAGGALPRVAAAEGSRTSHNLLGEAIGLVAYDPVSYFPEGGGKPVRGLISISAEFDGVTYRFATEAHKAVFLKNPAKYVPAFGGWCTWAVAELGKRVDVDPESYVLKNGRLLVFYRDPALDTRAKFLENPDALLKKAEANWQALAK
jgi:YHS domain-containing protein